MSYPQQLTVEELAAGIRAGERAILARAITLIESAHPAHQAKARGLLQTLLPESGTAYHLGITGVPGAGKSTMIDRLGISLIDKGHRVAVLAVDPTSQRSGGSILGDKTRMQRLATHRHGFVRPSPASGTLGGVARKTRETMALVAAAGYDIVIVETVGVGQSEVAVAGMVDFFLVLQLADGGDELQGIKKGIIELADMIAINKADSDNLTRAERAAADYRAALALLMPVSPSWQPPVITISARDNIGLDQLWDNIQAHHTCMRTSGEFSQRRANQNVRWMHDMLNEHIMACVYQNENLATKLSEAEAQVRAGNLAPSLAVDQIVNAIK